MKGTDKFKTQIQQYVTDLSTKDSLFAEKVSNEKKNIDDCINYIINAVHKSGCNGFTDDEIFGMAVHYYEEQDIAVPGKMNASVVVNHKVELTEDELAAVRVSAMKKVENEIVRRATVKKKSNAVVVDNMNSLF